MSSRRRQDGSNMFERKPGSGLTLMEMDAQVYGALSDGGILSAVPVSIHEIRPDARQPRRQVPSALRHLVAEPDALFSAWMFALADEWEWSPEMVENHINLLLDGDEVSDPDMYQQDAPSVERKVRVMEQSLLAVVNLAADIRRIGGLTNPITIAGQPGRYLIETGERRWLAYHLLNLRYGAEWERIPARKVQAASVWRQASENTARANLNAISMARQFAVLLMDLLGADQFQPFEAFEGQSDRAYYGQVADGNTYRVPRGKGEQLLNAMNLKEGSQLRHYRDLLRLPDAVWMTADDLNWTEYFIRVQVVGRAVSERQIIHMAEYFASTEGYTVSVDTVSDDAEAETDGAPDVVGDDVSAWDDADLPPALADILGSEVRREDFVQAGDAPSPMDAAQREALIAARQAQEEADRLAVERARQEIAYRVRLLNWAYKRGQSRTTMYFSASFLSHTDCGPLNELVAVKMLTCKAPGNQDVRAAVYRISALGCQFVELPVIDFEALEAGVQEQDAQSADERAQALLKQREAKLVSEIQGVRDQVNFSVGQLLKKFNYQLSLPANVDTARAALEQMRAKLDEFEKGLLPK